MAVVGRDARQIDGLGGAHPLTSKVAIVSPSVGTSWDIDYLFVQVVVGENRVDLTANCGNILSGVGAFAIETGMIVPKSNTTTVKVNMLNSNKICELTMQTPNGEITYEGNTKIDGVPESAAPVICHYLDTAGSISGSLFPANTYQNTISNIDVTCVDNGMPVVVNAEDIVKYADFFEKFDLPIVVDHMGRVPTNEGIEEEAFKILCDFMQKPNWWVKISCAERISNEHHFMMQFPIHKDL